MSQLHKRQKACRIALIMLTATTVFSRITVELSMKKPEVGRCWGRVLKLTKSHNRFQIVLQALLHFGVQFEEENSFLS